MNGDWMTMDRFHALAADEVHIWRIDLEKAAGLVEKAYAVLTPEERERAGKIRAGVPRDEFVAGRGSLRRLLGEAVGIDPKELALEKGSHGKPRLQTDCGVEFNVAHSRGLILIGLTKAGEIGLDVEYRDSGVELDDVARMVFHDEELAEIAKAETPEMKVSAFYRFWARKEAVLKADGRGLTMEPRLFAVGPESGGEVEVGLPASLGGGRYFVRDIAAGPDYAVALALPTGGLWLRCTTFCANFL